MELQIQTEITQAWFNYEAEKKKIAQYKAGVLEDSQKVLDGMVYKYKREKRVFLMYWLPSVLIMKCNRSIWKQ